MKFAVKLRVGSETREHDLDLCLLGSRQADSGQFQFLLHGKAAEADWAEIVPGVYSILVGRQPSEVLVRTRPEPHALGESPYVITVGTRNYLVEVWDPRRRHPGVRARAQEGPQEVLAPMPGRIVKILVSENQQLSQGDGLLVIEAMKMQNELHAPRAGRVEKIYIAEGTGVETGFRLLRLV
jgi:biotin carboxyl carrier protein